MLRAVPPDISLVNAAVDDWGPGSLKSASLSVSKRTSLHRHTRRSCPWTSAIMVVSADVCILHALWTLYFSKAAGEGQQTEAFMKIYRRCLYEKACHAHLWQGACCRMPIIPGLLSMEASCTYLIKQQKLPKGKLGAATFSSVARTQSAC